MTKILATCAAVAMTAAFAMPVPASGDNAKRADGVRNMDQIEVSAKRKYRRNVYRYYDGPRYGYRYDRRYYGGPYYAYSPYYRPYYRPGVSVGVGPFGFGFGF